MTLASRDPAEVPVADTSIYREPDDPMAVVGADMRVHCVAGLRVIDASMMPNIIRGNTNAAVMAVADLVLADMANTALQSEREAVHV